MTRRLTGSALVRGVVPALTTAYAGVGSGSQAPAKPQTLRSGVTLTWISALDNQANQDARNSQIARFRKQQPGIQVERQRVEGHDAKLVATPAANTPPDLHTTVRANVTSQATRGFP